MSQRKLGEVCNCENVCSAEKKNNMIYIYMRPAIFYHLSSLITNVSLTGSLRVRGGGWGAALVHHGYFNFVPAVPAQKEVLYILSYYEHLELCRTFQVVRLFERP